MKESTLRQKLREGVKESVEEIDPDKAAIYLRVNKGNRELRPGDVRKWRTEMEGGHWMDHHPDPVIFDTTGALINGQHRLHALIQAKKTIVFTVWRNADPRLAHVIDVGRIRTVRDSINIMMAETVPQKHTQMWGRFVCGMHCAPRELPYTHEEHAKLYNKYADTFVLVCSLFTTNRRGVSKSGVRAAIARAWVASPKSHERIEQFVRILHDGMVLSENDIACLGLRDHLQKKKPGAKHEFDDFARTEHALSNFLRDRGSRLSKVATQELFPLPEDALFMDGSLPASFLS